MMTGVKQASYGGRESKLACTPTLNLLTPRAMYSRSRAASKVPALKGHCSQ